MKVSPLLKPSHIACPRSPLVGKAFLKQVLSLVKLAINSQQPGKRYFLASSPAGMNGLVFGVGSGVVSY